MASRKASRTVCCFSFVPSGQSGAVFGDSAAVAAFTGTAAGAAGAGDSACEGAGGVALGCASAGSPSASIVAIGLFTFTFSLPSATIIWPITPSSTASNSIVALSVSISAMISPAATTSPSLTIHFANVPSSIVGERAGIRISIAIINLLML